MEVIKKENYFLAYQVFFFFFVNYQSHGDNMFGLDDHSYIYIQISNLVLM